MPVVVVVVVVVSVVGVGLVLSYAAVLHPTNSLNCCRKCGVVDTATLKAMIGKTPKEKKKPHFMPDSDKSCSPDDDDDAESTVAVAVLLAPALARWILRSVAKAARRAAGRGRR